MSTPSQESLRDSQGKIKRDVLIGRVGNSLLSIFYQALLSREFEYGRRLALDTLEEAGGVDFETRHAAERYFFYLIKNELHIVHRLVEARIDQLIDLGIITKEMVQIEWDRIQPGILEKEAEGVL